MIFKHLHFWGSNMISLSPFKNFKNKNKQKEKVVKFNFGSQDQYMEEFINPGILIGGFQI